MKKTFCDKCGAEISHTPRRIVIECDAYTASTQRASIDLCENCYKELGVSQKIHKRSKAVIDENVKSTTEQLHELIKKLISECIEELK